jgi:glycosyltransferase involved in cell wall biosynthesis
MNNKLLNITFFTPTLQKTGSEMVLFNLLKYLPNNFNATIVTIYKGILYDDIPNKINKDFIFKFQNPSNILFKIYYKIFRKRILQKKLELYKDSVWYINTIVLPDIIDFAVQNKIKIIVHVHELAQMYKILSSSQLEQLINYPKMIIANSNASKSVLLAFKSNADIRICYPAINTDTIKYNKIDYNIIRKSLNINENEFIWTMVGSIDENKNPKLFIDIAVQLKKQTNHFKLMWIGSSNQGIENERVYLKYAEDNQVSDSIIWITNKQMDYLKYFNCADGFILTSKLESFSLVTLEAMLLGLPVVANNCIGVNEVLGNDYGIIIDNSDSIKMSQEMLIIMNKPKQRESDIAPVKASKFDISIWNKIWLNYLNDFIKN